MRWNMEIWNSQWVPHYTTCNGDGVWLFAHNQKVTGSIPMTSRWMSLLTKALNSNCPKHTLNPALTDK